MGKVKFKIPGFLRLQAGLLLLLFSFCIPYASSQGILNTSHACPMEQETVPNALRKLADCSGVEMVFSASFFTQKTAVTIDATPRLLGVLLQKIVGDQPVQFKVERKRIIFQRNLPEYIFSGYVEDADSGERLIAATIHCPELGVGAVTNEYGFFSLQLPAGQHQLTSSYLGFQEKNWMVELSRSVQKRVQLRSENTLAEVVVTPDSIRNPYFFSGGEEYLQVSPALNEMVPSLGGEHDPVRAAHLLPGVLGSSDGLGGFHVRGGDNGHNQLLLDGVAVYIPYHALGMLSIYNGNTVQSMKLLTGNFPARYGGSVGSVLDVRIREGNRYEWQLEGGVNLTNGQVVVEGPILKEKLSVLLAGRLSHSNFLFTPVLERTLLLPPDSQSSGNYYDYNLKVNYQLSQKDRFYLSWYEGYDDLNSVSSELEEDGSLEEYDAGLDWGNQILALRWNHLFGDRLFGNLHLTHSQYTYDYSVFSEYFENEADELQEEFYYSNTSSFNQDSGLRFDLDFHPNAEHSLRFGAGAQWRNFSPSIAFFNEELYEEEEELEFLDADDFGALLSRVDIDATEYFAYGEETWRLAPAWQLDLGLRWSAFETETEWHSFLEPRVMLNHQLQQNWRWSLSAYRMVQYLHLIPSSALQFPTDLWYPTDQSLNPQEAWVVEGAVTWSPNEETAVSLGAYQKVLRNLYILPSIAELEFISTEELPDLLLEGEGSSTGLELSLDHHRERGGLIASYVLSSAEREYRNLNNNEDFPFSFDARHQFKLLLYGRLGKGWNVSTTWYYNSPTPRRYVSDGPLNAATETVQPGDNQLRATAYHRLDLSVQYERKGKYLTHHFEAGAYNLYDRDNVTFYQLVDDVNPAGSPVRGLGFRPSLRYYVAF